MKSLKIYLQQSHRCQEFSHNDINAQGTSYTRTCTLVQRYKVKHALRQNSTKLIKLFDFLFLCVFGFLTQKKKKKKNDKSQQCKKYLMQKQTNNQLTTQTTIKHTTKHSHTTQEVLMHKHVVILMHEYPSSPIRHVRLG